MSGLSFGVVFIRAYLTVQGMVLLPLPLVVRKSDSEKEMGF